MKVRFAVAVAIFLMAAPLFAQEAAVAPKANEVRNLEPGFPTAISDTTTLPQGTWNFGLAGTFINGAENDKFAVSNTQFAVPEVIYGILPNLQAFANMPVVVGEGRVDGNFDITFGVLYRINDETEAIPSFALGAAAKAPTGLGNTGWDGIFGAVVTKSFGQFRAHVGGQFITFGKPLGGSPHIDAYFVGADYAIADNILLIADVTTTESRGSSHFSDRVNTAEVGARYALSDCDVVGAALGTEFGPSRFVDFQITLSYQRYM